VSNIYLKDCPQCTSSNPIEAVFCRCGFCFDPGQIKNTAESLAHLAHEEEVYLEYLQARVEQSRSEQATRQAASQRDPANTTKSAELLLATQALSTAEAEYSGQLAKVQALSNHKNVIRFVRNQARTASDNVSPKKKKRTTRNVTKNITKGVTRRTKGTKSKKTTSMQKNASRRTTPNQPAALKSAVPLPPRPGPIPVLKRPVSTAAPVARPAPASRPAPTPGAAALQPVPPRAPVSTAAAKSPAAPPAPPIVRDVDVRPATGTAAVRPQFSAHPTAAFRAAQAARAHESKPPTPAVSVAPIKPVIDPGSKECPHCTAILPQKLMNCRCGYHFGGVAELPALSLSPGELASILGALGTLPPSEGR